MPTFQNVTSSSTNTLTRACVLTLPAGTVSVTAGSNVVTGSSTAFTTWLRVRDDVIVNGEKRTVSAITSDTSLTTETNYTNTASGQTLTYFPSEFKGSNKVLSLQGYSTNTAAIFVGESVNAAKNGADISSTSRTEEVAVARVLAPTIVQDCYNLYFVSSAASQRLILKVNS